MEERRKREMAL